VGKLISKQNNNFPIINFGMEIDAKRFSFESINHVLVEIKIEGISGSLCGVRKLRWSAHWPSLEGVHHATGSITLAEVSAAQHAMIVLLNC
jgi:hypothetical protein